MERVGRRAAAAPPPAPRTDRRKSLPRTTTGAQGSARQRTNTRGLRPVQTQGRTTPATTSTGPTAPAATPVSPKAPTPMAPTGHGANVMPAPPGHPDYCANTPRNAVLGQWPPCGMSLPDAWKNNRERTAPGKCFICLADGHKAAECVWAAAYYAEQLRLQNRFEEAAHIPGHIMDGIELVEDTYRLGRYLKVPLPIISLLGPYIQIGELRPEVFNDLMAKRVTLDELKASLIRLGHAHLDMQIKHQVQHRRPLLQLLLHRALLHK